MKVSCGMLVAAAVTAAAPALAQAPAVQPTGTSYVVTYLDIAPSAKGEAINLLKQVAAASRKETGNQRYDILQRIDRTNQFAILEAWTDLKAAEAHGAGAALKEFKDKLKSIQVSFYDERPSNGVAVAPAPASISKGSIFAITHVDVIPPKREECVELLKNLADATRKEPGAERFEAWVQNNRSNHFTVTEIWKDMGSIEGHIVTASTRDFRDKLAPMAGALYDERLYTAIE